MNHFALLALSVIAFSQAANARVGDAVGSFRAQMGEVGHACSKGKSETTVLGLTPDAQSCLAQTLTFKANQLVAKESGMLPLSNCSGAIIAKKIREINGGSCTPGAIVVSSTDHNHSLGDTNVHTHAGTSNVTTHLNEDCNCIQETNSVEPAGLNKFSLGLASQCNIDATVKTQASVEACMNLYPEAIQDKVSDIEDAVESKF